MEITDEFVFQNRFTSSTEIRLTLPAGLRFLDAESPERVTVSETSGTLTIRPHGTLGSFTLRVVSAANLSDGRARLQPWLLPGIVGRSSLALRPSEEAAPVIAPLPGELSVADAKRGRTKVRLLGCPATN